jgi:hypothetical protein
VNIYMSTVSGGLYTKLNYALVTTTSYTDSTVQQAAEKITCLLSRLCEARFFRAIPAFFRCFSPRPVGFVTSYRHYDPGPYTAGISFTRRTRLAAVTTNRTNQSTFFTPRTLTCRRMLSSFAQPNTFSTSLRFR